MDIAFSTFPGCGGNPNNGKFYFIDEETSTIFAIFFIGMPTYLKANPYNNLGIMAIDPILGYPPGKLILFFGAMTLILNT